MCALITVDYARPIPKCAVPSGRLRGANLWLVGVLIAFLASALLVLARPLSGERTYLYGVTRARTDVSAIASTLETFSVDTGRYPTTAEGLKSLLVAPSDMKHWQGPYLAHAPTDPWGNPYMYRLLHRNGAEAFEIRSKGPDRKEDSHDDIVAIFP